MGHKPHTYIMSHVKDRDALPLYEKCSPNISTVIDTKNQGDEKPTQAYLDGLGPAQRQRYFKKRD